jgi:hypothetical protein
MNTTKNILKVTKSEMIEIFKTIEKSTFVNLVTEVVVKMNKTNNPYYGKVIKKNRGNYLIGNEYGIRVGTNQEKEGIDPTTFEVRENWFQHVSKCVVKNKKSEDYYLQYEFFKESNPVTEYIFEGQTIDQVLFQDFLVKRSEPTNQPQERKVFYQTYKMDSIKEFSLNGTKYIIED